MSYNVRATNQLFHKVQQTFIGPNVTERLSEKNSINDEAQKLLAVLLAKKCVLNLYKNWTSF